MCDMVFLYFKNKKGEKYIFHFMYRYRAFFDVTGVTLTASPVVMGFLRDMASCHTPMCGCHGRHRYVTPTS